MVLRMYIDEVAVDEKLIASTENIALLQQEMIEENIDLIDNYDKEPVFYIEGVPSKANLLMDSSVLYIST